MMSDYSRMILEQGGGICTCGEHLGVFVAPLSSEKQTPPGWVFVPAETATEQIIDEAITHANAGRKIWPPKEEKLPSWKPLPKEATKTARNMPISGRVI